MKSMARAILNGDLNAMAIATRVNIKPPSLTHAHTLTRTNTHSQMQTRGTNLTIE